MAEQQVRLITLGRCSELHMLLNTPKGRGVFAKSFIASGAIIETCPVLILSAHDAAIASRTLLNSYTYNWPSPDDPKHITQAVVLGLGSMFNHSVREQNVGWKRSVEDQILVYTALRDISPGEELCINYGKVWFQDTDADSEISEEDAEDVLGRIEV